MNSLDSRSPDRKRPAPPRRGHLFAAAGVITLLAIYGSLVPFKFEPVSLDDAVRRMRLIEQRTFFVQSRTDLVANILLFVPLGFLWLGVIGVDRSIRRTLVAVLPLLLLLASFSVALEFSQIWFRGRMTSSSDIVAQVIGAVIGASLWIAAGQALVDWVRSFFTASSTQSRWFKLLQFYVLGLCIYSVMPLDLTISVGELYAKFKGDRIILVPFGFAYRSHWHLAYNVLIDTLLFVPVGVLAAMGIFRERRVLRSIGSSIAWGGLFVAAIELAQLIVFSRVSDVTDLITGTAGVAIGAWLAHRLMADSSVAPAERPLEVARGSFWKWVGITVAYMLVLVAVFWAPFEFRFDPDYARPRLERFFEVPFKWIYRGSEFKAVYEVTRKTLFFGVLGALCVQVVYQLTLPPTVRRVLLFAAGIGCAGWAMGIELGQIVSAGEYAHTPDFTDVLLCTIGATMGMLIATRVLKKSSDVA